MADKGLTPTVLVVDDEPTNLNVLIDTLDHEGLNVSVARSGEEALIQVEKVKPDLLLLDVLMPGIDGFETCRRLKANKSTREFPVIFMTALSDSANFVKGFEVGGVDYLTKPIRVKEVLARVNAHLTIRKLQLQVEQKNAQLEKLNANKDKFFSIIAHDLKNSFIGFLSFAKTLEQLDESERDLQKELTSEFREQAENLFNLLENLLTWSRIQRGMVYFVLEPISLRSLALRNAELFMTNAKQKNIQLKNLILEERMVSADVNMLDTIIRNLLSNAIKFCENGGTVKLSASIEAENTVKVSVADSGIGISEEKLPKLFKINERMQRPGTANEQGTGLGLILCKEFVEKHGGRIGVESEAGKGTTVWFTLQASPLG